MLTDRNQIFVPPGQEGGRGRGSLACVSLYGADLYFETLPSQPGMPLMPNVHKLYMGIVMYKPSYISFIAA